MTPDAKPAESGSAKCPEQTERCLWGHFKEDERGSTRQAGHKWLRLLPLLRVELGHAPLP